MDMEAQDFEPRTYTCIFYILANENLREVPLSIYVETEEEAESLYKMLDGYIKLITTNKNPVNIFLEYRNENKELIQICFQRIIGLTHNLPVFDEIKADYEE